MVRYDYIMKPHTLKKLKRMGLNHCNGCPKSFKVGDRVISTGGRYTTRRHYECFGESTPREHPLTNAELATLVLEMSQS